MKEKEKREGKVWFRFLKVAYIFCYAVSVIGVGIVVFVEEFPRYERDSLNTEIQCNNGKVLYAWANGIYTHSAVLDPDDHHKAIQLCLNAGVTEKSPEQIVSDNIAGKKTTFTFEEFCGKNNENGCTVEEPQKNYNVFVPDKIVGSWTIYVLGSIFGLIGVFIVFEAIKRTFLYIAFGIKFFGWKK